MLQELGNISLLNWKHGERAYPEPSKASLSVPRLVGLSKEASLVDTGFSTCLSSTCCSLVITAKVVLEGHACFSIEFGAEGVESQVKAPCGAAGWGLSERPSRPKEGRTQRQREIDWV